MTKFELKRKILASIPVERDQFIQKACEGKSVLDLGCIRHSAEYALADPDWMHEKIKSVATDVVGIDYLPDEVKKLNEKGYQIIFADVTKRINLDQTFDVIVAGDLIEHLVNFEGFFENCSRLLKPEGILIISTPNPFFSDEFHFVAFKEGYLINPEHTCWIDPQALSQLSDRFNYRIDAIHFVKKTWHLRDIISETEGDSFDILNGSWVKNTYLHKFTRKILGVVFGVPYFIFRRFTGSNRKLVRYSDYVAVLKKNQ